MTKQELKKIMIIYETIYPNYFKDINDVDLMIEIWFKKFAKYSYQEMNIVADRLTSRSKFMPSVAEIIEELEFRRNPLLQLNAEEEWENVLKAIRKYGSYQATKAFETLNPFTLKIVRIIGWNRLCESTYDQMTWIKKDFIEIFENKKDLDYEAISTNEKSLTLAELMRRNELQQQNLLKE